MRGAWGGGREGRGEARKEKERERTGRKEEDKGGEGKGAVEKIREKRREGERWGAEETRVRERERDWLVDETGIDRCTVLNGLFDIQFVRLDLKWDTPVCKTSWNVVTHFWMQSFFVERTDGEENGMTPWFRGKKGLELESFNKRWDY